MDFLYRNLKPYDAMLIGRARAWGVLCMAAAGEQDASLDRMVGSRGDRGDVERLVTRLETMGYVERSGDAVALTPRGQDATAATRRSGVVPRVVQDDPSDWRQRAWTSVRIRKRFTVADVAGAADAPSVDAVSKYLRDLVELGHLRRDGFESRGRYGRWAVYRLVDDPGPAAPERVPRTQEREHDDERPWRRRAWSALWRLCPAGGSATVAELAAAARVPAVSAGKLLAELHGLDALVRELDGQAYRYALTPRARERAEPALRRSDRPAGRAEWRRRAWRALLDAGRTTARETAEVGPCALNTARQWLAALAADGHLERLPHEPPASVVYVVPADAPVDVPSVTIERPSRAAADADSEARPEEAVSDA